jgi:hypothetical protein
MKLFNVAAITIALMLGMAHSASAEYLPSNTQQSDQVESVDLMVQYLSEESYVPSRLELRQISSDAVSDLIEIANGRHHVRVKNRAIQSLALYRSDQRAADAVEDLLAASKPGEKLFPSLIVSYAQLTGERGVKAIAGFVDHDRQEVRMAAVVALGRFGGADGYEVLAEAAESEEHPVVRDRIENYIR